jgi:hypothetical protein
MTVERQTIEGIRSRIMKRQKIEGPNHRAVLTDAHILLQALDERSRSLDAAILTVADFANKLNGSAQQHSAEPSK